MINESLINESPINESPCGIIFSSFVLIQYLTSTCLYFNSKHFLGLWFQFILLPAFLLKFRVGLDSSLLINFQCIFFNSLTGKILLGYFLSIVPFHIAPVSPGTWPPPKPRTSQSSVLLFRLVPQPQLVQFNMVAIKSNLIKIK